ERHVARVPRAVAKHLHPGVARPEGVRAPRSGRTCHDAPPPHGVRLVVTAEAAIGPEFEAPRAVEDDEDLLLGAVAVRRVHELAGRDVEELYAGLFRASGTAQVADCARDRLAFAHSGLDVADVADPGRTRGQLADRRRADRDLPCPGVVVGASLEHPRRAEPRHPGARAGGVLRVLSLTR